MWFVKYYIAGNPLPHTYVVSGKECPTPADVCNDVPLGADIMEVTISWVQTNRSEEGDNGEES